ncbi:MAG: NAD-dependent epimerase/dehydratase family protein [Patescibacteria group bacterium]|nr:NAD-dependent epimerase/dehydratase family protein [Patescibacteria group bacterium]MDE1966140.1 NAD-dependent epimerase/dehydratase family protein [Patescibacteria group bacterium]
MKIFITGIAGAIGSNIAERFSARGDEVSGVDAYTDFYDPLMKRRTAHELEAKGIRVEEADIASADLPALIPEGTDFIFHAAAQPGIAAWLSFDTYLRNNIIATHRLVKELQSRARPPKLVFISTSSVYGIRANGSEETPPRPSSDYGVTKLAAEQDALAAYRDAGLPVTALRLFSIYGERERPDKLFRKLIEAIDTGTPFPLYDGARAHLRSYTYVGDVVDACERVCERFDACAGELFNIGSDVTSTTGEGIDLLEELMGKKGTYDIRPPRSGEQLETSADIGKARRVLGYEPKTTLREGLARELSWCRAHAN